MVADAGWMLQCGHGVRTGEHSLIKRRAKSFFSLASDWIVVPETKDRGQYNRHLLFDHTRGKENTAFKQFGSSFMITRHQVTEITRALQLKALMISFQFKIICDYEVTSWNVLRRSADTSWPINVRTSEPLFCEGVRMKQSETEKFSSVGRSLQWQTHLASHWTRQLTRAKPWSHMVLVVIYSARNQLNHSKPQNFNPIVSPPGSECWV